MEHILSPSILSADFSRLGEEVKACRDAGAQYIHIDVMDGCFVPNITFGPPVIKAVRKCTDAVFDVHLMIEEPIRYLDDFKDAGADIITVHAESCRHLDRTIQAIHELGLKAGAAINPATPVETLYDIFGELDMVLLMSVNPGFGGQKFIPYVTEKIKKARARAVSMGLPLDIQVDGGVTKDNAAMLKEAGVNVFVAGSAVFKGGVRENIRELLGIIS